MPLSTRTRWGLGLTGAALLAGACAGYSLYQQARSTAEAYAFGYPLVIMELTKQYQLGRGETAVNQLNHRTRFPDHRSNSVVAPNVDTLYSLAHLDLRAEPVVLSIPASAGHYYMMPILDAWTNVVASPGTRTLGDAAERYLIVGPGWQGTLPDGMQLIRVPTQMGWIIGRFKSSGPHDYAEVNAQQRRFDLQPLSHWQKTPEPSPKDPAMARLSHLSTDFPPDQQLAGWTQDEFFSTLCQLLPANPPSAADAPQMQRIRETGLISTDCQPHQSAWQRLGSRFGYRKVTDLMARSDELRDKMPGINGWKVSYDLGQYGDRYAQRALVAKMGLGANTADDAIYPNTRADQDGQLLSGKHRYLIHFDKAQLPPVKGFWSLTLYNTHLLLADNPLNRYAVGDRDDLHYNPDGSLDLYIQHEAPERPELRNNWLPAPENEFSLFLRLYWPKPEVLQRDWRPPLVQRQS
ncbi:MULTISPECIES: DUF1254 domain-containing protein [Pseudomonas]|uniref:DUF1254 domain-containing protein n=11 Tax=Gammaproteobacteria TaxID=1236 RepID=G8CP35_PSEAI|nr:MULTISPECIES: DUF1254 domain-containing protein [Pseudomonas]KFB21531.1 hypothetical protein PGPR2_16605 [Pseudomonas aeruginosa PGPR2]KFF31918.1 hypothetical protein G039_0329460 [Pseudomonas aeruginosa VRFPA01]AEQ93495.1 hypothetical protein [Pseudomonas aeruginosa]AFM65140.1 hypothetical protein PADK2_14295 [Pseudomonas aeruginosa DK2]EIE45688.1 hypothetical protein CF510_14989 [Pseudomonas aeruginosa PADK2_CF510]